MSIINLSEEPEHIPTLAAWHHAQWSYLNPLVSVQKRIEEFQECLGDELVPTTYIYKHENELAGSASILMHDMQTYMDLTPWFASLYVTPKFRNRGIGTRLVRHAMDKAREGGINTLYLFTPDKDAFYAKLGWVVMSRKPYHGADVTIMQICL